MAERRIYGETVEKEFENRRSGCRQWGSATIRRPAADKRKRRTKFEEVKILFIEHETHRRDL